MQCSPERIERLLMVIAVVLTVLGVVAVFAGRPDIEGFWAGKVQGSFVRQFSLDREANLPTWFASALLLMASAGAFAIGRSAALERGRWTLIALVFLVMSIDEAAVLHEMLIVPLQALLDTGGLLYYAWVMPGGVAAAVVALYLLPFVWGLPTPVRARLLLAGAVYLGGALGVEAVTGWIEETRGRDLSYQMLAVVEETLEMVGVIVAISALLHMLERQPGALRIRFERHLRS